MLLISVPAAKSRKRPAARAPLRILMVASEAHPFAKTGGLAEVAGALPAALAGMGHDVTVVLPRYRVVEPDRARRVEHSFAIGAQSVSVTFMETALDGGGNAVLVDNPALFDRPGLYNEHGRDYPDNAWRFAVLSRAALEYARVKGIRPSILHAHDWQTGLVPVYQKTQLADDPIVGGVPAVFTIHNLAFQGNFPAGISGQLGLGPQVLHMDGLEYWGQISFLKGGVNFSEKITTVSPTYAREILTPESGFGMHGVLQRRAGDLAGILNGIDVDRWNPSGDPFIPEPYSARDLSGKRQAKRALLREAGIVDAAAERRPLIGVISRLTDQKGFDLFGAAAGELMSLDASWVMLGSGDAHYEEMWRALAERNAGRVSTTIGFDERLAHLIEAGADMFVMPSRFEPCGLNQMYSLRYGTVPIVRATGGLQDTVIDASEPGGTGFTFTDYTPGALVAVITRALEAFGDRTGWARLQREGMKRDLSWDVSAREYVKVYMAAIDG